MVFERLKDEDFAYLTTTGRKSGRPHRIEIWFAIDDGKLYLLSGGADKADDQGACRPPFGHPASLLTTPQYLHPLIRLHP